MCRTALQDHRRKAGGFPCCGLVAFGSSRKSSHWNEGVFILFCLLLFYVTPTLLLLMEVIQFNSIRITVYEAHYTTLIVPRARGHCMGQNGDQRCRSASAPIARVSKTRWSRRKRTVHEQEFPPKSESFGVGSEWNSSNRLAEHPIHAKKMSTEFQSALYKVKNIHSIQEFIWRMPIFYIFLFLKQKPLFSSVVRLFLLGHTFLIYFILVHLSYFLFCLPKGEVSRQQLFCLSTNL